MDNVTPEPVDDVDAAVEAISVVPRPGLTATEDLGIIKNNTDLLFRTMSLTT